MSESFFLRWRSDASGFVARFAGQIAGGPFATRDEAEALRAAMPNGGQVDIEAAEVAGLRAGLAS